MWIQRLGEALGCSRLGIFKKSAEIPFLLGVFLLGVFAWVFLRISAYFCVLLGVFAWVFLRISAYFCVFLLSKNTAKSPLSGGL